MTQVQHVQTLQLEQLIRRGIAAIPTKVDAPAGDTFCLAAYRPMQPTSALQPIAAFAGLWRIGELGPEFAFLTTEPNPLMEALYPKAMPVILLAEDHDRWLTAGYDQALALQNAYPSQLMAAL